MFKFVKKDTLEYFISDLFPQNVIHAFTTRRGGMESESHDEFSIGKTDVYTSEEQIESNLKLLCAELGMNYNNLIMTNQHHTDNIFILSKANRPKDSKVLPYTDGVITKEKSLPVILFFADCTPIMLYDKKNGIMGLVHAGWRGTAKQIVPKAVQRLVKTCKSHPKDIIAAIGPSIGKCCYEVSSEVANQLLDTIPEKAISDKIVTYKSSQPYVDLKQINAEQLRNIGIKDIDVVDECTACNQNLFFSYRATDGHTGRQALIAQLV